MKRTHVISSSMISVGYNAKNKILEIEFPAGTVYDYFKVPESEYESLMNAESKGKYFNEYIKPFYLYKQVA